MLPINYNGVVWEGGDVRDSTRTFTHKDFTLSWTFKKFEALRFEFKHKDELIRSGPLDINVIPDVCEYILDSYADRIVPSWATNEAP